MSATELLSAVLQLPTGDRRELILKAWESLGEDQEFDPVFDLSPEAHGELGRRIDEIDSGAVQPMDAMDALARARSRFQESPRS